MCLRAKDQQREHILRRAQELARTGRFLSYQDIEWHLRFGDDACPEARDVLDDEAIRERLNRLCREARIQR